MILVNCFRMLFNLSDEILLISPFHFLSLSTVSSTMYRWDKRCLKSQLQSTEKQSTERQSPFISNGFIRKTSTKRHQVKRKQAMCCLWWQQLSQLYQTSFDCEKNFFRFCWIKTQAWPMKWTIDSFVWDLPSLLAWRKAFDLNDKSIEKGSNEIFSKNKAETLNESHWVRKHSFSNEWTW